ncbi:hypothetical protein ABZ454_31490 [Streptomyces sp. NPDC005803]
MLTKLRPYTLAVGKSGEAELRIPGRHQTRRPDHQVSTHREHRYNRDN